MSLKLLLYSSDYIGFNARGNGSQPENASLSVEGTETRFFEQNPFEFYWYSHKCNRAMVRYEIGVYTLSIVLFHRFLALSLQLL